MTDILFELAAIEEPDKINVDGKIIIDAQIIHPAAYYDLESMMFMAFKHEVDITYVNGHASDKIFAVKPGSNAIGYSEYDCNESKEQAYIEAVAKFMVMYLSTEPEGGEV